MKSNRKLQKHGGSIVVAIPPIYLELLSLSEGNMTKVELIDRHDGSIPFIKITKAKEDAELVSA